MHSKKLVLFVFVDSLLHGGDVLLHLVIVVITQHLGVHRDVGDLGPKAKVLQILSLGCCVYVVSVVQHVCVQGYHVLHSA